MNKEIDTRTLGVIGGIFMFAISAFLFFLVWNNTRTIISDTVNIGSQYQGINITSEKKTAEDLTKGKNNLSGMPIVPPKDDATGQTNPF